MVTILKKVIRLLYNPKNVIETNIRKDSVGDSQD